ncbi:MULTISPECIES: alpha/beta fold hydrolase [unclassified Rhodococcus (in: high G+C Gram-positive bacteria)]|uniref:alpha/beta fold hydrolase n=1 Tax=unclassified Rhodococcus (in: high G+C Gram-positive bacteria) TaxID=192944 RepID=UPI0016397FE1|nr:MULTISPECIES: alpha/beta hydrolase [unclassified Rhodococcus (in: high G+C Gram-positive bacteria)]MBC2638426.1 alpha/beta hydrolase [Rhodococcus sp. 3A]MBC2896833.1 alpha/beta hydrolase [Rhodococcus sp. 4CII]
MTPTHEVPGSSTTHVILVPGFWLGAWAWESVASDLAGRGHHVSTPTLPGLDSVDTDRRGIRLDDHVSAVVDAVAATPPSERAVVVAHSGAGPVAYAASDRVAGRPARLVYVDSGPLQNGTALRDDLDPAVTEIPLPSWSELEAEGSSLGGLDDATLTMFRSRAVPQPAGPARDTLDLRDAGRLDVPSTVICTSFPSDAIRQMAEAGHPMVAELAQIANVDYVDLPTGHWPMWSRPADLASAIDAAATN